MDIQSATLNKTVPSGSSCPYLDHKLEYCKCTGGNGLYIPLERHTAIYCRHSYHTQCQLLESSTENITGVLFSFA